jgi:hypothetical protein
MRRMKSVTTTRSISFGITESSLPLLYREYGTAYNVSRTAFE